MTPIEQAIDQIWETLYDHGNGKYKGDASKAQLKQAFATLAELRAQPDHSELAKRLRHTASKGVSVWGDLMIEAADALESKP